eukprot:10386872-Lingulodinium_polyedra.AAC.1
MVAPPIVPASGTADASEGGPRAAPKTRFTKTGFPTSFSHDSARNRFPGKVVRAIPHDGGSVLAT